MAVEMATAAKRPRMSNSAGVSAEARNANVAAQFDDFRRRHIKQNKEIIQTNVTQKIASKALQDEVLALKAEIHLIRQQNAKLHHRLQAERRSGRALLGNQEAETARNALETILSTLPTLQALHASLGRAPSATSAPARLDNGSHGDSFSVPAPLVSTAIPPSSSISGARAKVVYKCPMPDVSSRRLAGEYRAGIRLDSVSEDEPLQRKEEERYVEIDEEDEGDGVGAGWVDEGPAWDGSSTPTGSRASRLQAPAAMHTANSPTPTLRVTRATSPSSPVTTLPISTTLTGLSPSPSQSPSRARASPTRRRPTKDKRRGRRESGLLKPLNAVRAELVVSPASCDDEAIGDAEQAAPEAAFERDVEVARGIEEEDDRDKEDEDAVLGLVSSRTPEPEAQPESKGNEGEGKASGSRSVVTTLEAVAIPQDGAAGFQAIDVPSTVHDGLSVAVPEAEEAQGRAGRRARSSVSYKEPSLNKKMRKPDGYSLSGQPDNDERSAGSTSSRKSRSSTTGGSLRRKSALPKPGRKGQGSKNKDTPEDSSDLSELDPMADLPSPALDDDDDYTPSALDSAMTSAPSRSAASVPYRTVTYTPASKAGTLSTAPTASGVQTATGRLMQNGSSSTAGSESVPSASIRSAAASAPAALSTASAGGPKRTSPRKGPPTANARAGGVTRPTASSAGRAAGSGVARRLAAAGESASLGMAVGGSRRVAVGTSGSGRSTPNTFA